MMSLEEAKKIISKRKKKYSDKEIVKVLAVLDTLVKIEISMHSSSKKQNKDGRSSYIYACVDR